MKSVVFAFLILGTQHSQAKLVGVRGQVGTQFASPAMNFKTEDGKLLLRIFSATWCPPCQYTSQGLKDAGILHETAIDGVLAGKHKVRINGVNREVIIEKIETDLVDQRWQQEHEVPSNLDSFPQFTLYNGKNREFVGSARELARAGGFENFLETRNENLLKIIGAVFSLSPSSNANSSQTKSTAGAAK